MRFNICFRLVYLVLAVGYLSPTLGKAIKDSVTPAEDSVAAPVVDLKTEELKKELEDSYDSKGEGVQPLSDDDYKKPNLVDQVHEESVEDGLDKGYSKGWNAALNGMRGMFPFMYPPPLPPWMLPNYGAPASSPVTRYLKTMDKQSRRKRRNAFGGLVNSFEVANPSEWWYDLDQGMENKVTEILRSRRPGFATQQQMLQQFALYGAPQHIGTINTGHLRHPHLAKTSDRSFGQHFDFNDEDLESFAFKVSGQRFHDAEEFIDYLQSGYLPVGTRFIVDPTSLTDDSKCWTGKDLKTMPILDVVDEFSIRARELYWYECNCADIPLPGTYALLGGKLSTSSGHVVIMLRSINDGRVYAISNFNAMGLREWSPSLRRTAYQRVRSGPAFKGRFRQGDMAHSLNSEFTGSGNKIGGTPAYTQYNAPMYDQSRFWYSNTGRNILDGDTTRFGIHGNAVGYKTRPVFPSVPPPTYSYYYGGAPA